VLVVDEVYVVVIGILIVELLSFSAMTLLVGSSDP